MMNDRVIAQVNRSARAYYEGVKSSAEAYADIDRVALHWANDYPGVVNETRELFDKLVDSYISDDVDQHRSETYESRELRRLRDAGTQPDEDFFRMKLTGNGETRWMNITPAQMDALIRVFEV